MSRLILLLLFFDVLKAVDWCQQGCDWLGQKNLKCIFKERTYNDLCPNIQSVITSSERADMLAYHNNLRNDVAGGNQQWRVGKEFIVGWTFKRLYAGDMRQMVWDYGLEENARIYASQCDVKAHEPYQCAGTKDDRVVHMNKFDNSNSELTMNAAFSYWVNANKKSIRLFYKESVIVKTYFPGPYNDFFATIFSQTYKLGCAKVICDCNQVQPLYSGGSIVCLYGPAPNLSSSGWPVYDINRTCSSCPEGTRCHPSSDWPNLCARRGDPNRPADIPDCCGSQLPGLLFLALVITLSRCFA